MNKLYHKEFAKLHSDVCFGKSDGKIIWQPRIGCWYTDKMYEDDELQEKYKGMDLHQVYRSLGVSGRLYEFNECFRSLSQKKFSKEHQNIEVQ